MIAAKFHCPGCGAELDCPADDVGLGVECPKCKLFFAPEVEAHVERKTGTMPGKWQSNPDGPVAKAFKRRKLEEEAAQLMVMAKVLLVVSVLCIPAAVAIHPFVLIAGGVFFPTSLVLFLGSHLVHIRASLEK